ncbi:YbhB/YbcL family Raf kinase inhibitor-like protein [Kribbella sp. WER1]
MPANPLGVLLRNRRAGQDKLAWARPELQAPETFTLTSPAFEHGTPIPPAHRGHVFGANISPPLAWTEPPAGTLELVLIVQDPDVPHSTPAVHALTVGINPSSGALPANALTNHPTPPTDPAPTPPTPAVPAPAASTTARAADPSTDAVPTPDASTDAVPTPDAATAAPAVDPSTAAAPDVSTAVPTPGVSTAVSAADPSAVGDAARDRAGGGELRHGRGPLGRRGWIGPMPIRSHGPHAYVFQLFALDRPTDLPPGFTLAQLTAAITGHLLGRARLDGTYEVS